MLHQKFSAATTATLPDEWSAAGEPMTQPPSSATATMMAARRRADAMHEP
jgi:hypothetical protein